MYSFQRRTGGPPSVNIWPGFVDALSALLMVVIFVLMVFMVAQFYLSNLLSGREEMVARLDRQLAEVNRLLDLERQENAGLRSRFAQLSTDMQRAAGDRDGYLEELAALRADRDLLAQRLDRALARAVTLEQEQQSLSAELVDAYAAISADREVLELRLRELASLQADLQALRDARQTLEVQIASLSLALQAAQAQADTATTQLQLRDDEILAMRDMLARAEQTEQALADAEEESAGLTVQLRLTEEERDLLLAELGALRDRSRALEAELSSAEERTLLAQREIDDRDIRLEELMTALSVTEAALEAEELLRGQSDTQVTMLNRELVELRDQLDRVEAALRESESRVDERDIEIASLNTRLNQALIRRVEELSRYRSEFFGRLREVIGDREDIRVVGDRFVFQSEVLFPSGSATLQAGGREQLARFAATLLEISATVPAEVDWILRVDGHTDRRPIATAAFPSNWELSTARALSVVRFLNEQGVPQERMAAAGFGEFQPLDPADTDAAYERNRRIELKLDQR